MVLHGAAESRSTATVQWLLDAGAKPDGVPVGPSDPS